MQPRSPFDPTPFDLLPVPVFVVGTDARFKYANETWWRYVESPPGPTVATPRPFVHDDDWPLVLESWRAAQADGKPYQVRCRIRRNDGAYRWNEWQVSPFERDAEGLATAWIAACIEIQQERELEEQLERARDRAELLDRMSLAVASAPGVGHALQAAVDGSVSEFADIAVLDLLTADGVDRAAVATRDFDLPDLHAQLRRYAPDPTDKDDPGYAMIASGQPLFLPVIDPAAFRASLSDDGHVEVLEGTSPHSAIIAPLIVENASFGAMTFLRTRDSDSFNEDDYETALELARRAALHIDRTRVRAELERAVSLKDELLGMVSHEVRTPVAVLVGSATLLRRAFAEIPQSDRDELFG